MTEKMTCPYNPAHVVEPRRYRQHIDKCRKTALNAGQFTICTYDLNHHVPKKDIVAHEANCPARIKREKEIFRHDGHSHLSHLPKPVLNVAAVSTSSEENWDDAPQMQYNPEERVQTSKFMVVPAGLTPAEKKQYRKEHQQRLSEFKSKEPESTASTTAALVNFQIGSNPAASNTSTQQENEDQPPAVCNEPRAPFSATESFKQPLQQLNERDRDVTDVSNTGTRPGSSQVNVPAGRGRGTRVAASVGRAYGSIGWTQNFKTPTAPVQSLQNDDDFPPLS